MLMEINSLILLFTVLVNRYRLMCLEQVRLFHCFSSSLYKRFVVNNLHYQQKELFYSVLNIIIMSQSLRHM